MINVNEKRMSDIIKTAPVACQGVKGAYSEIAANAIFGNPDIMYMRTFEGVFRAVDKGLCRYGVLPLENSNAGSVTAVYDLMKEFNFYIVRSAKVSISHMLLANKKTDIKNIKEIYTHEQSASQCGKFIKENPHIKVILMENNAVAAKFVAGSARDDIAAIASEKCAELYGLKIIAKNVQNGKNNYTRFICISKTCEIYDGADKISVMFSLPHVPGSLYGVLKQFADLKINLTKLESRPIADADFEFMFYFDAEANVADARVYDLLQKLSESSDKFIFLGNYGEITAFSSDAARLPFSPVSRESCELPVCEECL